MYQRSLGVEQTSEPKIISSTSIMAVLFMNGILLSFEIMVRQRGLEPMAYCLEGSCSIQLSYWRIYGGVGGTRTHTPGYEPDEPLSRRLPYQIGTNYSV